MLLFCNFIVASCNIVLLMLIRIALYGKVSLPVSLLAVKINSSVLKFSMDRYKSVKLELRLHIGSGIPNGVNDWIRMQAKLFLQEREPS